MWEIEKDNSFFLRETEGSLERDKGSLETENGEVKKRDCLFLYNKMLRECGPGCLNFKAKYKILSSTFSVINFWKPLNTTTLNLNIKI